MESDIKLIELFKEISKYCNYRQLIAINDFWHNLEKLDQTSQNDVRSSLVGFFKCPTCTKRVIRFEDGGRICNKCNYASAGHEQDRARYSDHLECLKCFKFYKSDLFASCSNNHLCGFCAVKEKAKGRDKCRICHSNWMQSHGELQCGKCENFFHVQNVFEIRCGCRLCNDCFKIAKTRGSCSQCVGVSITTSEMYEFLHRDDEICFFCENNYKIVEQLDEEGMAMGELVEKKCCYLDICKACFKRMSPQNVKCAGCEKDIAK